MLFMCIHMPGLIIQSQDRVSNIMKDMTGTLITGIDLRHETLNFGRGAPADPAPSFLTSLSPAKLPDTAILELHPTRI